MTDRLKERTALITGAGRGIGRATARRFAAEGCSVLVVDLEGAKARETVDQIEEQGGQAHAYAGDVTEREQVHAMVEAAVEAFGRLDVVVNNAGITRDALTVRMKDGETRLMDETDWDAVLDTNLKGSWLVAQEAALVMIPQNRGRIINTSSVGALGSIGQANYSASKAGIIGLTRTLALEWARYNIAVNCVAPGAVETRLTAAIPEKIAESLVKDIPFRRMARPEEIAAVHTFLASEDASYVTGQVIWVDGGLTVGA